MSNISFIIPTFNNYNEIRKCLKSILKNIKIKNQSFEIIIVDDGSNFKNFKKLENYISSIKKK